MSEVSEKLTSSKTNEHYTPLKLLLKVSEFFENEITLDPASNSLTNPQVPALSHYTKELDGLNLPWSGKVFCNPPYGRLCPYFVDKAIAEYLEKPNEVEILLLVKSATETQWYSKLTQFCRCNIRGRLKFGSVDGKQDNSATFPSVLFYLGTRYTEFAKHWQHWGEIVIPPSIQEKITLEKQRQKNRDRVRRYRQKKNRDYRVRSR